MAPEMPDISPYAYANCNPVVFNDPTGMVPNAGGDGSPGNPITIDLHSAQHNVGSDHSAKEAQELKEKIEKKEIVQNIDAANAKNEPYRPSDQSGLSVTLGVSKSATRSNVKATVGGSVTASYTDGDIKITGNAQVSTSVEGASDGLNNELPKQSTGDQLFVDTETDKKRVNVQPQPVDTSEIKIDPPNQIQQMDAIDDNIDKPLPELEKNPDPNYSYTTNSTHAFFLGVNSTTITYTVMVPGKVKLDIGGGKSFNVNGMVPKVLKHVNGEVWGPFVSIGVDKTSIDGIPQAKYTNLALELPIPLEKIDPTKTFKANLKITSPWVRVY